jgi:hypothetical protein
MKDIIKIIRSYPVRVYLVLFLLLIIPALALYPLAESGSQVGMMLFLVLIILANVAAMLL